MCMKWKEIVDGVGKNGLTEKDLKSLFNNYKYQLKKRKRSIIEISDDDDEAEVVSFVKTKRVRLAASESGTAGIYIRRGSEQQANVKIQPTKALLPSPPPSSSEPASPAAITNVSRCSSTSGDEVNRRMMLLRERFVKAYPDHDRKMVPGTKYFKENKDYDRQLREVVAQQLDQEERARKGKSVEEWVNIIPVKKPIPSQLSTSRSTPARRKSQETTTGQAIAAAAVTDHVSIPSNGLVEADTEGGNAGSQGDWLDGELDNALAEIEHEAMLNEREA